MPKGTPNGTSVRDLSQYKKGKYSLHKKGAVKQGGGNWDKLIDDKYLMLTDANVVEAYEVGDDRKVVKIGTAESIVEARLLFCQGAKNWKMSYDGIPVDGNKGNALPQDAKQAKKTTVKQKGKQPQAPTATSDPITTAPAEQLTPANQPTSTTSTMVAVEDYHDIHSAVADNDTWMKTTALGVTFDRNGVKAKKKIKKGTLAIQVTKGRKQLIIKPVFQFMLPLVLLFPFSGHPQFGGEKTTESEMNQTFPQGGYSKDFESVSVNGGGLYDPFFFERKNATHVAMGVRRVCNEDEANMKKVVLGGRAYLILSRYLFHILHNMAHLFDSSTNGPS